MTKEKKLYGTVGAVMGIMLVGKATGLLRDMLLRRAYGTEGIEAKALALATNIPRNFLDFAFASVISAAFIPVFNQYLTRRGDDEAFRLADGFISAVLLITAGCTALGAFFAPQVAAFFAPGYDAEALALSIRLLRVMMATLLLSGAAFSLTGVLQSLGEFNVPAAMSVVSNLLIIVYLALFADRFGVYGLCAAFLVGWATQTLVQLPSLYRKGYKYRPALPRKDAGLAAVFRLMPAALIGSWVVPVNTLVNQRVASRLFEGAGAAVVDTANQLYAVVTGVFILSISNVVFPRLAKQEASGDGAAFTSTLKQTTRAMAFFLIPMTCGLMALAEPITRLLFEGGRFDGLATARTAAALKFYALGMVGFGLQTVLSRAFFAQNDGKTPMLTGLLAMAANAGLSVAFAAKWGVAGVGLAASCSITLAGGLMFVMMSKRGGALLELRDMPDLAKMVVCAAVMTVVVWLCYGAIGDGGGLTRLCAAFVPAGVGVCVYMALAYLFRLDEARAAFGILKRRVQKMGSRK